MVWKLIIVNGLTLIRIIGTIILVPIYRSFGGYVAGIISLICYFTDCLDGVLARKWKASTFFGAIFDGLADKMFTLINFIILYLITPYALIPIFFEFLTVLIQMIKFNKHYNIKANIVGKLKVWVLAACAVLTFVVSDIDRVSIIPEALKNSLHGAPIQTIYFWILLPAMIMTALTFISYVIELFNQKDVDERPEVHSKIKTTNLKDRVKNVWFNHEFYEVHKDDANLRDLRKMTKE